MRNALAIRSPLLVLAALVPLVAHAQSFNGSVTGRVLDQSGAVVSGAELVLKNVATGLETRRTSTESGEYAFRNLTPSTYELRATAANFGPTTHPGLEVRMNSDLRVDVTLNVGGTAEEVTVTGATTLNFESGAHEDGIAPDTLQQLPLLVSGTVRSSAAFVILAPGVSTGGTANPFDARINGGQALGDEAVLDGVSMQQGHMSQSGMVSLFQDFPFSPDMVSEMRVLTSSYEPQYGASTSGQVIATTKSGGESFHGALFEYFRNDRLNATQFGADQKPINTQHNFGANIGGPIKLPGLWSGKMKSYFYVNAEGFRIEGGVNRPTISIPSMRQRSGDFSDWRDASGNLIPIYDPATTRTGPDGTIIRDPFPGNIIPANRINPLAREWLSRLPTPTNNDPLNNYLAPAPIPDTILGDSNYLMARFDTYIGSRDHVAISLWHQRAPAKFLSILPREIATETYSDPQNSWVNRLNWDHTFGPNLLHHLSFGYLNRNEGYGCVDAVAVDEIPKIPGVPNSSTYPPQLNFSDGFSSFGCNQGINEGNISTRPTYIANNLLTWIKGDHTWKFGLEYRNIAGNIHNNGNESGTFGFGRGATGILGQNSGSPIASFLLGAVDNANAAFRSVSTVYPRQAAYAVHVGDTWKASSKLTLNLGLRWDIFTPSREKFNRFSFLDPNGPNPGAGGRPGRLAFAGDEYGAASYGAEYPEELYKKAFAPRLGLTYGFNQKTVFRAGWGIFYDRAYYPGWGGAISQDGFTYDAAFSSRLGGLEPAFLLQQGLPQNFARPPFIQSDYRNGQSILYRPLDANERARSHQWNLTLDREVGNDFMVSAAYVGSRGVRLFSNNRSINVLDPALLSLGTRLYDEFQPGQQVLHGVSQPYAGWREQMTGCAPSLAQALLPYPQYCGELQGINENHGKSWYHSAQFKGEKRFSGGTYALISYTLARLMTSGTDNIQRDALTWSGASGVISPFEEERNYALASDDVTHTLSAALVYELPIGKGRKFLDRGGVANAILGGWTASTVFRYSSGIPFFFRSSFCNVPGQFGVGCIPAIKEGANPWAQDKGSFDPAKGPLFNKDAFESVDSFNFYYGRGERVTDLRSFAYKNQDLTLVKNTSLGGRVNLQLRFEAFNLWNWHIFNASGSINQVSAFNTDLASPEFGQWSGAVSNPRNIQIAARLEF
jgi:hypothetical protein